MALDLTLTVRVLAAPTTALATAAASLAPGQCVRMNTPLTGDILRAGGNDNIIQWGGTGVYDPVRSQVQWIGKQASGQGNSPFHFLVYDELANGGTGAWSTSVPSWSSSPASGHGYDHSAGDPATGDLYHRQYASTVVQKWNGSWSALPNMPSSLIEVAASLSWWPGKGLIFSDGRVLFKWNGTSWSTIQSLSGSYDSTAVSEYNETANVMVFTRHQSGTVTMHKLLANESVADCQSPPIDVSTNTHGGLLVTEPGVETFLAYKKDTTTWRRYRVSTDAWSSLTQSSGDPYTPQNGTPNLSTSFNDVIAINIARYGVVMFIQYLGPGSTLAGVWLYKPTA